MKNSAKSLLDYAVKAGYKVAVRDHGYDDILQKSTTSWKKVKDAIESTGMVEMVIRDTEAKKTVGVALVITHDAVDEWVSDFGCNSFMDGWWNSFTADW